MAAKKVLDARKQAELDAEIVRILKFLEEAELLMSAIASESSRFQKHLYMELLKLRRKQ